MKDIIFLDVKNLKKNIVKSSSYKENYSLKVNKDIFLKNIKNLQK